jgi:hypothetical protein
MPVFEMQNYQSWWYSLNNQPYDMPVLIETSEVSDIQHCHISPFRGPRKYGLYLVADEMEDFMAGVLKEDGTYLCLRQ